MLRQILGCSQGNFYPGADIFFNFALTDANFSPISIAKLLLSGGEYAEGNSIYRKKFRQGKNTYIPTLGFCKQFFSELEIYLSKKFDTYNVMLRLNLKVLKMRLIQHKMLLVIKINRRFLKDVKELKGEIAFNKLFEFMNQKGLLCPILLGIDTWLNANQSILKIIETTYTE